MDSDDQQDPINPADQAISSCLSRLRSMPVDTSRLDRNLKAALPLPQPRRPRWLFLRPMRAIAAGIAILLVISAVLFSTSGGAVLASATQMAQMHRDMISGKTAVMQVDSIEQANRAISQQWSESPAIPGIPADHGMACCMKSVKNKKVACVLFKSDEVPITMTVANAADMRTPTSPTVVRNGITYHVQSVESLYMVMTQRDSRWVCLIGQLPAERLMDIASKLEF